MKYLIIITCLVCLCSSIEDGTVTKLFPIKEKETIVVKKSRGINVGLRRANGSFRLFRTNQEGFNALIHDIELKQSGKSRVLDSTSTIEEFVRVYAPKIENDTEDYLRSVIVFLGIERDKPINEIDSHMMAKIILKLENVRTYKRLFGSEE